MASRSDASASPVLSPSFCQFFRELAANNQREWFHANKKRFETEVKRPFLTLTQGLIDRISALDAEVRPEPEDAMFRIYRDVRFSQDKSPYKLHMSALLAPRGRKDMQAPGLYVQADAERLFIAGGCYMPDRPSLTDIRQFLADHPDRVFGLLGDPAFRKRFPQGILGERNKILPPEFREAAARQPLIFHKQFYFQAEYAGETYVTRPDLPEFITDHYRDALPWIQFLRDALQAGQNG